jgi:hypothetical protein
MPGQMPDGYSRKALLYILIERSVDHSFYFDNRLPAGLAVIVLCIHVSSLIIAVFFRRLK